MKDRLRASLLALRKNPRRNHLRFYCIVPAKSSLPPAGRSFARIIWRHTVMMLLKPDSLRKLPAAGHNFAGRFRRFNSLDCLALFGFEID